MGRLGLVLCILVGLVSDFAAAAANVSYQNCPPGLLLPAWTSSDGSAITTWGRILRGVVYFFALLYLFLGVSIISDRFMGAIEVITSQEREVVLNMKGEKKTALVRVWNETVANLTLMALGSSAPEILLSVIEVWAKNFQAGELGPGTIVGSAAYNLFVIIAICVSVIPDGEVRKIKQLGVFFVTATWSIFAYIWLYLILAVISQGVVEVWEGIVTFLFFPLTVLTAFIADKKFPIHKLPLMLCKYKSRVSGVIPDVDIELAPSEPESTDDIIRQARVQSTNILKELKNKYPDKTMDELKKLAQEKLENTGSKSRAFYRIQAARNLTGGSMSTKVRHDDKPLEEILPPDDTTYIQFAETEYTVLENVGSFTIKVVIDGPDFDIPIYVDYQSEDGTANAGSDYMAVAGTLVFKPGQRENQFKIKILDDDVFEEDEYFYVKLLNERVQQGFDGEYKLKMGPNYVCKILILDDDHGGAFTFSEESADVSETVGEYEAVVERRTGARGRVSLPYYTMNGSAVAGRDYVDNRGTLIFEDNESRKTIPILIMSENSYERNVNFSLHLSRPTLLDDNGEKKEIIVDGDDVDGSLALEGYPVLGDFPVVDIHIRESLEFKETVDRLVESRGTPAVIVGTSSWREQFAAAFRVKPDDDDGDDSPPSFCDYVIHFLALFWKVVFAFVPPTEFLHGWICFWVSMMCIGILTAVIGDLASAFGCIVGIADAVTAISIVALGTSLPDTFASKVSAIGDSTADNSVGNVTGSNAVNVFLGIGVAWSIAALYHAFNGNQFTVPPGNLAYSVTLFCSLAVVAILIIFVRRNKYVGGELGGPRNIKYMTSALLVSLWLFYVIMSTLEVYDVIEGF